MCYAVLLYFTPLYTALAVVVALLLCLALGVYLSHARLWKHIALSHTQAPQEGYIAPQYPAVLLGQSGTLQTPLHPVGKVSIQGQTYQATTEGTYLAPPAAVVVTAIMGHTLVVKPSPT